MSILNLRQTSDYISSWIKDYANKAGVKTLVLGLSGGIDSALVALLCQHTGLSLVCVNMPCHSSDSAFNRASVFASEQCLPLFKVDLSDAHKVITDQFGSQDLGVKLDLTGAGSVGGLRSCLRAPTLSFLAHATGGLIMGTGNRSEDNLTRYYQKFGDGCVDLSPIADLFKGEVRELYYFLAGGEQMAPGAKAIYDAVPSADLLGPDAGHTDEGELGISYDEIEWADREDMRTVHMRTVITADTMFGIIFSLKDPSKHPSGAWLGYTARQKVVISKIWAMEKVSRHKNNPATSGR